jgi:hypothetical protein
VLLRWQFHRYLCKCRKFLGGGHAETALIAKSNS